MQFKDDQVNLLMMHFFKKKIQSYNFYKFGSNSGQFGSENDQLI